MRRNSNSGALTSPGTPEYGDYSVGWSSERVAFPWRHRQASLISGRTLPSKWDDAERWITTSPISWTHPKSKSGPLGPNDGRRVFMGNGNSPLTTGVLSVHYDPAKLYPQTNIIRTATVSDFLTQNCVAISQDDDSKEEEGAISRRDMATQMSPEGSSDSSSNSNSVRLPLPAQDEIRDVQVDKGTTAAQHLPTPWDISKPTSKLEREEAKINAWEKLQKAKAEAAIRKLEMKLERERSASMDKIAKKLRGAQMKARAMRNSVSDQTCRTSHKGFSLRFRSISSCFQCTNT